ncbi:hypothetical protein [Methylobacterium nigriterrae]|uniref:hypothetical protein n=1 Tax=Methylobacterium nigriterrae TaxID=3127512 RepID=UPI003013575C
MPCFSRTEHLRGLRASLPILAGCLAILAPLPTGVLAAGHATRLASADADEAAPPQSSLVTAQDVSGLPGAAIPLAVAVQNVPGKPAPTTYLLGIPKGARLADASHEVMVGDEKSVVDVTNWNLPELSITLPTEEAGTYTLAVVAVSRPDNGDPLHLTRSTFVLNAAQVDPAVAEAAAKPAPKRGAKSAPRPDAPAAPEPAPASIRSGGPAEARARRGAERDAPAPVPVAQAPVKPIETAQIAPARPDAASPVTEVFIAQPPAIPVQERVPETARGPAPAAKPAAPVKPAAAPPPAPTPAAPPPAEAAAAPSAPEPDAKALVARAERLIKLGDISGARLILERAASRGNPQATFLLAQTCDPRMLRSWNVQGLKPDPDRARALYAKAAQDGFRDARALAEAVR